jgi:hypothetical protein
MRNQNWQISILPARVARDLGQRTSGLTQGNACALLPSDQNFKLTVKLKPSPATSLGACNNAHHKPLTMHQKHAAKL